MSTSWVSRLILLLAATAFGCLAQEENDGRTMDDIIVDSADSPEEFSFFYSPDDKDYRKSLIKVEYDMVYTVEQWEKMNRSKKRRAAGIINGADGGYRWKNNHIPYQLQPGTFNSGERGQIMQALNDWSQYTCLTFAESNQGNRLYFKNGGGCYSMVGMVGGAQTVGLAKGCRYKGVVIHEVGHALGLHHEQTRPDRNQYVRIHTANIPDRIEYNFDQYGWNKIQNFGIPYDYLSVMHYGARAFSSNRRITIETLDKKYQDIIGTRRRLSFRDIKTVNLMYKCREAKGCTLTDSQCPGEGFVGPDCKCWCDGDPYTLCDATTGGVTKKPMTKTTPRPVIRTTPETKTGDCVDQRVHCNYWRSMNECQKNPGYMLTFCKKSCNACGDNNGKSQCRDRQSSCRYWQQFGFCNMRGFVSFMRKHCQKSCNACDGGGVAVQDVCKDDHNECRTWAKHGHCNGRSRQWMRQNCKSSCNTCSRPSETSQCSDDNTNCPGWAYHGYCQQNPGYMLTSCKKSCNQC